MNFEQDWPFFLMLGLFAGFIVYSIVRNYVVVRTSPPRNLGDGDLIGSLEDLERAEQELSSLSKHDLEMEFYSKYRLVASLPSDSPITNSDAARLLEVLRDNGIESVDRWRDALPNPYASMPVKGYFDIFVARNQWDSAQEVLAREIG